jgi:hypothetical protein
MAGHCPEQERTVQKRERKKVSNHGDPPPAWLPVVGAFRNALHWALDRAAHFARDYPEEVDTVERVRRFVSDGDLRRRERIELDDVLFTLALVVAAVERDVERVGVFARWMNQRSVHVPRLTELERQWFEQLINTYEVVQSRGRSAA